MGKTVFIIVSRYSQVLWHKKEKEKYNIDLDATLQYCEINFVGQFQRIAYQ